MRVASKLAIAALATWTFVFSASAQPSVDQPVALEERSAARALDAIPAVFAIAQTLEGVEIDVSADGMARGYNDLADEVAAQDQLAAALGAYGFEGQRAWAETITAIFATYRFIRSKGKAVPSVDRALQQVLSDPGIPKNQKDAIVSHMNRPNGGEFLPDGAVPTEEDLLVVIGLVPHIDATIEMMRTME